MTAKRMDGKEFSAELAGKLADEVKAFVDETNTNLSKSALRSLSTMSCRCCICVVSFATGDANKKAGSICGRVHRSLRAVSLAPRAFRAIL